MPSPLPVDCLQDEVTVPKPLYSDCLNSDNFNGLIYSTYYGFLGAEGASLKASPIHKEIVLVLSHGDPSPYAHCQ
ncbi:hypothetical protein PS6_011556 [Mucor atramentarius]